MKQLNWYKRFPDFRYSNKSMECFLRIQTALNINCLFYFTGTIPNDIWQILQYFREVEQKHFTRIETKYSKNIVSAEYILYGRIYSAVNK